MPTSFSMNHRWMPTRFITLAIPKLARAMRARAVGVFEHLSRSLCGCSCLRYRIAS